MAHVSNNQILQGWSPRENSPLQNGSHTTSTWCERCFTNPWTTTTNLNQVTSQRLSYHKSHIPFECWVNPHLQHLSQFWCQPFLARSHKSALNPPFFWVEPPFSPCIIDFASYKPFKNFGCGFNFPSIPHFFIQNVSEAMPLTATCRPIGSPSAIPSLDPWHPSSGAMACASMAASRNRWGFGTSRWIGWRKFWKMGKKCQRKNLDDFGEAP